MAQQEQPPRSETSNKVIEAASFIVQTAFEMQAWSGNLDWGKRLVSAGVLTSPELRRAFSHVSRQRFLPDEQKLDEGYDHPISIGYGQTNSQPSMVGRMLEHLTPRKGHNILDVGSGSAWTTALLASVVGTSGQVIGTERIPELVEYGRENLSKYEFPSARIELAGDELGMPSEGPYNRILVSAHMLEAWVPELSAQLSPRGGIMVAPIATEENHGTRGYNQSIDVITRQGAKFDTAIAMRDVAFVPLVHDAIT